MSINTGLLRVARRLVVRVFRWDTQHPGTWSEQYGRVDRVSAEHEERYR